MYFLYMFLHRAPTCDISAALWTFMFLRTVNGDSLYSGLWVPFHTEDSTLVFFHEKVPSCKHFSKSHMQNDVGLEKAGDDDVFYALRCCSMCSLSLI